MKKSIIFLHGFPYDKRMWSFQEQFFSKLYNFHAIDLPGAGTLSQETLFSLEDMADFTLEYIKSHSLEKPILVGLSMGGYVALRTLEKNFDSFSALILLDTRSASDSNTAKLGRARSIQKLHNEGVLSFVPTFIESCLVQETISQKPEAMELLINQIGLSQKKEGLISQLLAMQGRTDTTEFLSQIQIPTLLLCGEKDTLTTPTEMQEMAKKISHSTFTIVPQSGHLSAVENSEFVNQKIETFLKEAGL